MTKGGSLKDILNPDAIRCLAANLQRVHPKFPVEPFIAQATDGLTSLELIARGHHIAAALHAHLPKPYSTAVKLLVRSFSPPLARTDSNGLSVFFYLPHSSYIANYGLDPAHNGNRDPFDSSMQAQLELTQRFTAEFSIRPYLIKWPDRTLSTLLEWSRHPSDHVRRLCSEGTRPRLPWGIRIRQFIADPSPALPILDALKDDPSLYVRRSVANHIGDIAKDHPELALEICRKWLRGASPERKWLIRHALRYPARKGNAPALELRKAAA